jgi:ArsR family transcriptional regulator
MFFGLIVFVKFIYNISISIDMKDFLFKAMGEETKSSILKTLLDGELCACEIPSKISRTQSNTSMHLAKLIEWNLVVSRRDGKMMIYSIKDKRVYDAFKLLKCQKSKIPKNSRRIFGTRNPKEFFVSDHDKKHSFFTGGLK